MHSDRPSWAETDDLKGRSAEAEGVRGRNRDSVNAQAEVGGAAGRRRPSTRPAMAQSVSLGELPRILAVCWPRLTDHRFGSQGVVMRASFCRCGASRRTGWPSGASSSGALGRSRWAASYARSSAVSGSSPRCRTASSPRRCDSWTMTARSGRTTRGRGGEVRPRTDREPPRVRRGRYRRGTRLGRSLCSESRCRSDTAGLCRVQQSAAKRLHRSGSCRGRTP
ncbi:hypothetical protein GALL_297270 [mine drainage metagenome]|uniref:Uncharacterized protein n=1 Tax=mine drainage metagenome TaxID=410659 RepID=A0A1J5QXE5_9ZZZZ